MSVILFSKTEVYQDLADAYERLKYLRYNRTQETYEQFYKALRRLYFANVATYLCQYHDNTSLLAAEAKSIDGFTELQGRCDSVTRKMDLFHKFLCAWRALQYNLVTNDGEKYTPIEAQK